MENLAMKVRAIIIDDEQNNLDNLGFLVNTYCPEVTVLGTAPNVDKGLLLIADTKPDLLFLDIQMPGKSGFDLLKALPDRDMEIVFVTAHDQYGIQAIKFSAIDYLLKPVDVSELKAAVGKVVGRLRSKKHNSQLENLLGIIGKRVDKSEHRIALPSQRETRLVTVSDIVRCESSNNYSSFFLTNGEEILVSKPIYEYEELLDDYGFIRCHQSHLVNGKHIVSLLKEDSGYLILSNGQKVPISRQRKDSVRKVLGF